MKSSHVPSMNPSEDSSEYRLTSTGFVHSVETFGTVDGPGIRYVIFFQGCPMRCQYCHNPDTWTPNIGTQKSVEELLAEYEKGKAFYQKGGITVTGGEPLLQLPFLTALFQEAKEKGIHTCLDTAGSVYPLHPTKQQLAAYEALFSCTDLVLLDRKHSDAKKHQTLTGMSMDPVLAFAAALERHEIPVIVRHVVVPGITYEKEELLALGKEIGSWKNLIGLDVLPYHTMGKEKYEKLGIEYSLPDTPALTQEQAKKARAVILAGIAESRKNA